MSSRYQLVSPDLAVTVSSLGGAVRSLALHGKELLAQTPWAEAINEQDAALFGGGERGWSALYQGGWHPLLPSAGSVPGLPFHGEAARRTWDLLEHGTDHITLQVLLRTRPLAVTRNLSLAGSSLVLEQKVVNTSDHAVEFTMTEHIAWGGALLGEGMSLRVDGAPVDLVPWSSSRPSAKFACVPSAAGHYELSNPALRLRVRVGFTAEVMDSLVIWQEHRASLGFPWWGQVDAIGVEPSSVDLTAAAPKSSLSLEGQMTLQTRIEVTATEGPVTPLPQADGDLQ